MNNGNLPAMPLVEVDYEGRPVMCNLGLTKREQFAAMAMQGILANEEMPASTKGKKLMDFIAGSAVDYADALLKALGE